MNYLIALISFLLPFVFLPTTSEAFEFPKLLFLYLATGIFLFVWTIKIVRQKKLTFVASPFYLPIFLLWLIFGVSTLFSVARLNSFFGMQPHFHWNFIEVCALSLFFFIVVNNLDKRGVAIVKKALIASGLILALWTFLCFFVLPIRQLADQFSVPLTPVGSLTALAVFLLVIAPLILGWTRGCLVKILDKQAKIYHGVFLGLSILSLLLVFFVGFLSLPWTREITNKISKIDVPQIISLAAKPSWLVSATSLRDAPILGSGPGTFLIDFTRYRPFLMLGTNLWDTGFFKPSNEVFEIVATIGVLGLLTFLFLIYKIASQYKLRKDWAVVGSLGVLFLAMLFTPTTVMSSFLLFLFLALFSIEVEKDKKLFVFNFAEQFRSVPYFLLGVSLVFNGLVFYGVKRGYLAEVAFTKSLDAAVQGNLVIAYNEQQEAISQNPYLDNYHRVYAQTNLALVNGLSLKENLTDDDRATIQALIEQVVRETRIVTENLSPADSRNWALRGQVYRGLIGAAQDAESWAIGAYQQAVFLDPLNLYLRINLGGIYYQLKDFDTAERIFRAAVQLKPDFANARFNLAAALREQGKIDAARKELETTKSLVEEGSVDAQRVEEELEKLQEQQPPQ